MIKRWEQSDVIYDDDELSHLSAGAWQDGRPNGITLHYTADDKITNVKKVMVESKVGYHFLIDRDGLIHQTGGLDARTNHAGKALWNEVSPNRKHISISVVSWGLVPGGVAWTGKAVSGKVETRRGQDWHVATPLQEEATMRLVRELVAFFGFSPANICGHDECALPKGRKVDPGGVLSRSTAEIRAALK